MSAGDEKSEKVSYEAKCHCGAVTYTVKIPSLAHHPVTLCNCSICSTNGYLLVYPDRKDIDFHSGYDQLKSYSFGRQTADHKFCPTCGSSLLIEIKESESALPPLAVNDIEPDKLNYQRFDGKTKLP
ncbi:Mss4-like [Lasallia pustulata]|uniref:Mss4-like n=1 Tax=Lasallia pustulata TaxID=136370 RepID=A0A1W5DAA4_9LECA|nr:Mss4-like [Lasallia pustulata]